jgi:hypothetical protein
MKSSFLRHWKNLVPLWAVLPVWFTVGPFVTIPRFYEDYPAIAWPIFFVLIAAISLYMILIRGAMLRIVSDEAMGTVTRFVLVVIPSMSLTVLGLIIGLWLKSKLNLE